MSANLTIENVPDEVAERLRERAKRNNRSLQGELLAIVEESVKRRRPLTVGEAIERFDKSGLRTASDSVEIIREMRDSR